MARDDLSILSAFVVVAEEQSFTRNFHFDFPNALHLGPYRTQRQVGARLTIEAEPQQPQVSPVRGPPGLASRLRCSSRSGHYRRLLTDFRQLRQAQLQFSNSLGMTPAARASIKLNSSGQPLDIASMASVSLSESEVDAALDAARPSGDGVPRGDQRELRFDIAADAENAADGDSGGSQVVDGEVVDDERNRNT